MNHEEVKFILSAYRPGGQDSNDPRIQDALEHARRDPVLEKWFGEEMERDAAIARSLQSIPVPENLRSQILAGAKVTAFTATPKKHRASWLFRFGAIAAAAALVAVAAYLPMREREAKIERLQSALAQHELQGWQTEAIETVSNMASGREPFDAKAPTVTKLESWLAENHGTTVSTVPPGLETLTSIGCKTFQWHGHAVSIVCFQRDKNNAVHMVVIDKNGLHHPPPEGSPRFVRKGDWITASWSQGDRAIMIATQGKEEDLRKLL